MRRTVILGGLALLVVACGGGGGGGFGFGEGPLYWGVPFVPNGRRRCSSACRTSTAAGRP